MSYVKLRLRVLTRLACRHPGRVLLNVTFFFGWAVSVGGGTSLQTSCIDYYVPHSINCSILVMKRNKWSTANGGSNNLALEKIYCRLILQIRAFWPPELQGHKTIISQRGVTGTPGPPPSYAPDEKKDNFATACLRPS